jgi:hypothetical protein
MQASKGLLEAERRDSAAAGSRSDVGADAGGSQLHAFSAWSLTSLGWSLRLTGPSGSPAPKETALDEHRWRHMKPLRQRTNLPEIQFAFATEHIRNDTLRSDLWQVGLGQAMLFHEKTQHVYPTACWHGMVLFFIGMQEWRPNAGGEPRPRAAARHERTLAGVGSSAWWGC